LPDETEISIPDIGWADAKPVYDVYAFIYISPTANIFVVRCEEGWAAFMKTGWR
jgi:hypothetical protein